MYTNVSYKLKNIHSKLLVYNYENLNYIKLVHLEYNLYFGDVY